MLVPEALIVGSRDLAQPLIRAASRRIGGMTNRPGAAYARHSAANGESVSENAGKKFTGQTTDPRRLPIVGRQRPAADEFFQSTAASRNGIVVAYYDRQYGNDDVTGFNDISITFNNNTKRVTSSSMPPETRFAGTFYGDYIRMAVSGSTAYPSRSDTRLPGVTTCPANPRALCQLGQDEDVFTARVQLDH